MSDETEQSISYLEQQLGLPAGAIEAQQRGEHEGLPIALRFGDVGEALKESNNPSTAEAVFELPSSSLEQDLAGERQQMKRAKNLKSIDLRPEES